MKDLVEALVQEDHKLLDDTGSSFDKLSVRLRGTLEHVKKMLSPYATEYVIAFIVLFLVLYVAYRKQNE